MAQAMLAVHTPEMIRRAVASDDVKTLTAVPGIGQKGAQRIILELRDRIGSPGAAIEGVARASAPVDGWKTQVHGGLVGLVSGGYLDAGKRRAEKRERKMERKEARWERKEACWESRYGSRPQYPTQGLESLSLQGAEQQRPDYYSRRSSKRRMHPRDRAARRQRGSGGLIGSVRKVMQEDVLYLMIVPMPSEAEIAEAREMLRMEKEKK